MDKTFDIMLNDIYNIMNVYIYYYRNIYDIKNEDFVLDNIDYTKKKFSNKYMSLIMDHIDIYKKQKNKDMLKLLDPNNIDTICYEKMYVLKIDNKDHKVCKILHPLMEYISKYSNWTDMNWRIYLLKSQ